MFGSRFHGRNHNPILYGFFPAPGAELPPGGGPRTLRPPILNNGRLPVNGGNLGASPHSGATRLRPGTGCFACTPRGRRDAGAFRLAPLRRTPAAAPCASGPVKQNMFILRQSLITVPFLVQKLAPLPSPGSAPGSSSEPNRSSWLSRTLWLIGSIS